MSKLHISKETLRRISSEDVQQVAGGVRNTWYCTNYSETPDSCPATTPYRGCDTVKTDCCA